MLITPDGLQPRESCCCLCNSGQYFRLGTLICDDCAQILEAINLVQFFTVDSDVNADTIRAIGHQFGLLCTDSLYAFT